MLLVTTLWNVRRFAPSDAIVKVDDAHASLLLVAMPGAPSSFLFLVARPGAPSSVLAPSSGPIVHFPPEYPEYPS